jgi:hypothetical protein
MKCSETGFNMRNFGKKKVKYEDVKSEFLMAVAMKMATPSSGLLP